MHAPFANRDPMATINISEADFAAVAGAAIDAFDTGHRKQADALDKIARKINAALTNNHPAAKIALAMSGGLSKPMTWKDAPCTFEHRLPRQ